MASLNRNLSPGQFSDSMVPDHGQNGWLGPEGSYGDPGPIGTGFAGPGVTAYTGN